METCVNIQLNSAGAGNALIRVCCAANARECLTRAITYVMFYEVVTNKTDVWFPRPFKGLF